MPNLHVLTILVRIGAISGLLGISFWLNAIELLDFNDFLIFSKNITLKKLPFILIGIAISSVSMDLDVVWVGDHYEVFFRTLIVYLLIITCFAILIVEQVSFFVSRIQTKSQISVLSNTKNKTKQITFLYLFFIILTFIIAVFQFLNIINQSYPIWLIFSIFSQILFSYLLFKYPSLFLTTEVPLLFMIISDGGTAIYSKYFNSTIKFSDQLIAGYLKALDLLGSKVLSKSGNVLSIVFQENSSLLVRNVQINGAKFKICYAHQGISFLAPYRLDSFINTIELHPALKKDLLICIENSKILSLNEKFELELEKIFF